MTSCTISAPAPTLSASGQPADAYYSYGLFRILLALCLGAEFFILIAPYYTSLITDAGVYSSHLAQLEASGSLRTSLLFFTDHPLAHAAVIAVFTLALLAFGFGYHTRIATLVLLLAYTTIIYRNPHMRAGADMLMRALLVWTFFLPVNRYFSVDAALDPNPRERPYPVLPLACIKIQLVMIYVFSAIYKLAGPLWLDGSAIETALMGNMYGSKDFGLWFVNNLGGILPVLTYAVIIFQFSFSFLIYSPWYNDYTRAFAIAGTFLMHMSFMLMLNIGMFPFVCYAYLVLLVPQHWWSFFLKRRRERLAPIQIFYDPDCGFCRKMGLLLREFCLPLTTPVLPASANEKALALLQEHYSWVLIDHTGSYRLKWDAVAYVLKQSPAFFWLGHLTDLPFLRTPFTKFYDWIGAHRPQLGTLTALFFKERTLRNPGVVKQAICVGFMGVLLFYQITTLPRPAIQVPWVQQMADALRTPDYGWARRAVWAMQLEQRWDLFAPYPEYNTTRINITGYLADGRSIDLQDRLPYRLVGIAENGRMLDFANHKWLKHFSRLSPRAPRRTEELLRYVCRQAEANRKADEDPVVDAEILIFTKDNRTEYAEYRPALMLRTPCIPPSVMFRNTPIAE